MIRRILSAASSRLPCRIISDGSRPYLERYYLFTIFGVRFYLHRFVRSDPDRGVHDHPWPWAFSLILRGWYYEERRSGICSVRWLNWLTGDTFHRVILPEDRGVHEVWTIFAHRARRTKLWGFLRNEGFQTIYRVHAPSTDEAWWKTAPKGRDEPRRMPL